MQTTGTTRERRLLPFLGLAALVHALVIGLVHFDGPSPSPLRELRLALAQPESAPSATAHPALPEHEANPHQRRDTAPAPAVSDTPLPVTDAAAPAEGATAADTGAESARVIAQVRTALARYFVYPMAARRQGWQGEVVIGFSVSREGHIDNVEVVRSSGYRLLDEAARASLARVGNLPDHANRGSEPLQLRMPIIYRLEG